MAVYDGAVKIITQMDTSGFKKGSQLIISGMEKLGKSKGNLLSLADSTDLLRNKLSSLSHSLKSIGGLLLTAFSVRSIYDFTTSAVELGSDLTEVQNVVDTVFESMADSVNEFSSNSIEAFGISETAAKKYTSTIGAMFTASGIAGSQMLEMSETVTALSADMASFFNLDTDTMFEKIQSGLAGQVKPLREFGIDMRVANLEAFALSKGITKAWDSMSSAEQTILRYNYLLEKTANAQGDFARTSNTWANQTRILQQNWQALKTTMGQGLINFFTPVVQVVNSLLYKMQALATLFRQFSISLFGNEANQAGQGVKSYTDDLDDLTDSITETEKAQKRWLSGLDEVHKLTGNDVDTSTFESGNLDLPKFDDLNGQIEKLDGLLSDLWSNRGAYVINGWNKALRSTKRLAGDVYSSFKKLFTDGTADSLADSFLRYVGSIGYWVSSIEDAFSRAWETGLGDDLAHHLTEAGISFLDFKTKIKETFTDVWNSDTGTVFAESLLSLVDEITMGFRDWHITLTQAWSTKGPEYAASILNKWSQIFELTRKIGKSLRDAWNDGAGLSISENTLSFLTGLNNTAGNLAENIGNAWNEADRGKKIFSDILSLIDTITGSFSDLSVSTASWIGEIDFSRLLDSVDNLLSALDRSFSGLRDNFGWLWDDVLLPLADFTIEYVIPDFINALAVALDVLNGVLSTFEPLWNVLKGAISWIVDFFTNNELAAQLLGYATSAFLIVSAGNKMIGTFSGVINIVSSLGSALGGLSGIFGMVGSGISGLIGLLGNPWVLAFVAAAGAIWLIWDNWDTIGPMLADGFNWILSVAGDVFSALGDIFMFPFKVLESMIHGVIDLFSQLFSFAGKVGDFIGGFVGSLFSANEPVTVPVNYIGEAPVMAYGAVLPQKIATYALSPEKVQNKNTDSIPQSGNGTYVISLNVDGKVLYEQVLTQRELERSRLGYAR